MKPSERQSGFTLVELAVVLVIIGLIVGGIVVGRDLIQGAKVRAVVSEQEKYTTTIYAFKNKFNALPGDFKNATTVWPSAGTTNGNNDSLINPAGWTEPYLAWQHLALAGMIEGQYTGIKSAPAQPWTNVPGSKYDGVTGWYVISNTAAAGAGASFGTLYGLILEFGLPNISSYPLIQAIPARDASAIDQKIDDGHSYSGRMLAYPLGGPQSCTSAIAPYEYLTSINSTWLQACALLFKMQD